MRTVAATTLLVILLLVPAAADENAVPPALSDWIREHADIVLTAHAAKDLQALKALAERPGYDPWLIADDLCARGKQAAALKFVDASSAVDKDALRAYFSTTRDPATPSRELLVATRKLTASGQVKEAAAKLNNLPVAIDTVVGIYITGMQALILKHLEQFEAAKHASVRASDAAAALGWLREAAASLYSAGACDDARGDYRGALASWTKELAIERRRGAMLDAARLLHAIGNVYSRLNEFEQAQRCYGESLAEARRLGDTGLEVATQIAWGGVLTELGQYKQAIALFETASELCMRLGDRRRAGSAWASIAQVYARRGQSQDRKWYRHALPYAEKAKQVLQEVGDQAALTTLNGVLLSIYIGLKDYEKAAKIAQHALDQALQGKNANRQAHALNGLENVHHNLGEFSTALAYADRVIALSRAHGYRRLVVTGLVQRARNLLALGDAAGSVASAREAVGIRQALMQGMSREQGARAREYWHVLAEHAVEAAVAKKSPEDVWYFLEHERAQSLLQELGPRGDEAEPATLALVQKTLSAKDTLVLYHLFAFGAFALVVTKEQARIVELGPTQPIQDACRAVRPWLRAGYARGLSFPKAESPTLSVREHIETVRRLAIDPLQLPTAGRLLIAPHESLCYVPFSLILPNRVLAHVASGSVYALLRSRVATTGTGVLALGDPAAPSMPRLPGSRVEAKRVGDVVLLGEKATVSALKQALARRTRWRSLHFACHGLLDTSNPMASALVLTPEGTHDGRFRMGDVYDVKISADLVVLSACETGKGEVFKSEGIFGFTQAFMVSGAPRVICSLWKVDDAATQALMIKFYELWNPPLGLGAAAALQQAQAFLRGHPKWEHPYFWAAWVLWGLPD